MTWTPAYSAGFTEPIILQILAIIQRDQRAALDYVGGVGKLPSFVTYQTTPVAIPQFPGIGVYPGPLIFDEQNDEGTRHYTCGIFVVIGVTHQEATAVSSLSQQYTRAVDEILSTLGKVQNLYQFWQSWPLVLTGFTQVNTTALQQGSVTKMFIASHTPEIRNKRNQFAVASTIELHVEMEEL